jgi:D-alanine-D-alanine ligase
LKVCTLVSSYERSESPFRDHDPTCDPARWLPEHAWERHALHKATAARELAALHRRGFDVFVNLCDGAWDEDRAGIEVVQTLERLEAVFTGAGSESYEPSRETMKRACHYAGVRVPEWAVARSRSDAAAVAERLRFPLIVKHPSSYGSIGMRRDARVETLAELGERIETMARNYGAALVEEFIAGREFTVLVAEPEDGQAAPKTYTPYEFRFPAGESFKHFDLKWIDHRALGGGPVDDGALAERLRADAAAMFAALGASGYGRCDVRLDAHGELYMLEINPNPGVFYPSEDDYGSADLILAHDPAGQRGFLEHLLFCAQRRRERTQKRWRIAKNRAGGFAMFAARPLAAGELIEACEERAQPIVSLAHVERSFSAQKRRWFAEFAWPLTDELHALWSDRPEDWRPIDHSCDPSAWLVGLDVVARRALAEGDAITLDYATFTGPLMQEFVCTCGSSVCRGVIRPSDHLESWLEARYGDHVSDYVKRARRSARKTS